MRNHGQRGAAPVRYAARPWSRCGRIAPAARRFRATAAAHRATVTDWRDRAWPPHARPRPKIDKDRMMGTLIEIPTLRTEHLTLRAFRASDFDGYAAMQADPE